MLFQCDIWMICDETCNLLWINTKFVKFQCSIATQMGFVCSMVRWNFGSNFLVSSEDHTDKFDPGLSPMLSGWEAWSKHENSPAGSTNPCSWDNLTYVGRDHIWAHPCTCLCVLTRKWFIYSAQKCRWCNARGSNEEAFTPVQAQHLKLLQHQHIWAWPQWSRRQYLIAAWDGQRNCTFLNLANVNASLAQNMPANSQS